MRRSRLYDPDPPNTLAAPTPAAPAPGAPPTPAPATPAAPPETVTIGGKTYKMSDLVAAQGRVVELSQYKEDASAFINGFDGTPTAAQEAQVRRIMQAENYDEGVISEYIQTLHQIVPSPQVQPAATNPRQPEDAVDPQQARIEELERRLSVAEDHGQSERATRLAVELDESVQRAVDNSEPLRVLSQVMEKIHGTDGSQARVSALRQDVHKETMAALRRRHEAGKTVDSTAFREESLKATQLVADRLRAVIGDPQRLGRVPETAPGEDLLVPRTPIDIKAVKYEGESPAEAQAKALNLMKSVLLEAAASTSAAEGTRV